MSKSVFVSADGAAKIIGSSPCRILRAGLTGELPYIVAPDNRVLFDRKAAESLKLDPPKPRARRRGGELVRED